MLHRIRKAMQRGSFEKFGADGPVEADETMIGGIARFMHKDKKTEKITGTGGCGQRTGYGPAGSRDWQGRLSATTSARATTGIALSKPRAPHSGDG
jgi:hypothetical protein